MLIKRAIAIIIDSIIVGIAYGIARAILGDVLGYLVFLIVGAAYQAYFLSSMNGQTPGKMLLGIRVVKIGGGALTPVDGVVRFVGYLINGIFLIGWIVAVFTGRGFHDRIAGTEVVDT